MPPHDALEPGPRGDYPNWPRTPDGAPDPARMPSGLQRHRDGTLIDVTPRTPTGEPIAPPTITPDEED